MFLPSFWAQFKSVINFSYIYIVFCIFKNNLLFDKFSPIGSKKFFITYYLCFFF